MSLIEDNNSLPGVYTEILSEYSDGYDTSLWGTTDTVTILGTAFDGPVGTPIKVYTPTHAKYIFGGVYDSKTKRQATLVANIQDAYDRGCRSIYAVRISGKSIHKDYQLAVDTNLKLRVSGQFPSNVNKNIYMLFDADTDEISLSIYKPAEKATIKEKSGGKVESANSVLVNKIDLYDDGLSKNDDLVDLIDRVNQNSYNNAIVLTIVDEDGNDVTYSSTEAKRLKIGDMFPGIYTIGRACNAEGVLADTKLELKLIENDSDKPYDSFEGNMYKKLSRNTNVAKNLPLYSKDKNLHELIGCAALSQYDFLKVQGKIDEFFLQDSIDYEEVDLSNFEYYKKLGAGFAINAKLIEKGKDSGKFKVVEVTDSKTKKSSIDDGIYPMLQNLPSRYRVLSGFSAGVPIKGKLPTPKDFKFAQSIVVPMLGDRINIVSKIDSKDLTEPKHFNISFADLTDDEKQFFEDKHNYDNDKIFSAKSIEAVSTMTFAEMQQAEKEGKSYKEGSKFLITGCVESETCNLLYIYTNGKFVCQHKFINELSTEEHIIKDELIFTNGKFYIANKIVKDPSESTLMTYAFTDASKSALDDKDLAIVTLENGSFVVAKVKSVTVSSGSSVEAASDSGVITSDELQGEILGTADELLADSDENDDHIFVTLCMDYNKLNEIQIKSDAFDYLTIDEVVDILSEDKDFSKLFKISTISLTSAQDFIDDIKDQANVNLQALIDDKKIAYDTNLLIPFRTDDTFDRQLAQHCMYTSLKTSPTHGFIGTSILLDRSLESIENMVEDLAQMGLDSKLVAKKGDGTNILNKDNLPYGIGRKISIPVGQYKVVIDNYTYISNCAAGYAGMVSCLPLDQSSTCQTIQCPTPMYDFTNTQLTKLTEAGFVTIKKSYANDEYVITDGVTMATTDSPYRRLSASRIADALEDLIRTVCEPYIGKQNNINNQNALRTAIKSQLDTIKGTLIESYEFQIVTDNSQMQLGEIDIDYSITPIYEIRAINNRIKVKQG